MPNSVIKLTNVSRYFGNKKNLVKAVDKIDLQISQGSFTVILGRSGSGKSTLLNLMSGLDKATTGDVLIEGKNLSKSSNNQLAKYRSSIGVIFQFYNLLPNLNAVENVMMGAWAGGNSITEKKAKEIMDRFGLGHRIKADVKTLSGGEKQRVAICRSLIGDPQILFCDEPTGALDSKSESQVMDILKDLNQQGLTIVNVTHNPSFQELADKVIVMEDGKVAKS